MTGAKVQHGQPMHAVMVKKKQVFALIVFVVIVIVIYIFYDHRYTLSLKSHSYPVFSVWLKYRLPSLKLQNWYQVHCFGDKFDSSLAGLENNLRLWKTAESPHCQDMYRLFDRIYSVSFRTGRLVLPSQFEPKVLQWLGNKQNLLDDVKEQHIIHLFNRHTREHMAFNPLRAKRPQSKATVDPKDYIKTVVEESRKSCDFCNYESFTSADTFGRIKTNYSISAANTFKVDAWHSLIIPLRHNPVELKEEELVDMYSAAKLWFEKVNSIDAIYKYPYMLFDLMPHGGASQIHPHMHVMLDPERYPGMMESTRLTAQLYLHEYRTSYFEDLVDIHYIMGLTVTLGNAIALAHLTSKKDTEIIILTPEPNLDFARLVYYVIKAYEDMGYYDFSSGTALPIMTKESDLPGSLPPMIRLATRGNVGSIQSEISSFDLFTLSNINVDPYEVIEKIKASINNRSPRSPFSGQKPTS